jgi:AcrR family transcriptional regulator
VTRPLPFYIEPTDPPSKRALLEAALRLFARDGVRESSIRAVAAEAGFTNPVLFKYFEGKDALALHLFERCYLRLVREAMAAIGSDGSFRERLRRLVGRLCALLDESPEAVLFVNEELRRFWPQVSAATRKHSLIAMTAAFFDDDVVTTTIDRKLLVAAFWGLMGQFARMRAFEEWRGTAVDTAMQLETLIWKMLKA